MQAEKQAGFPFARYAGSGLADFAAPAAAPPEEDIEQIAGQYDAVAIVLHEYMERLKILRIALDSGDNERLKKMLGEV